jgi:hypothetical protein
LTGGREVEAGADFLNDRLIVLTGSDLSQVMDVFDSQELICTPFLQHLVEDLNRIMGEGIFDVWEVHSISS